MTKTKKANKSRAATKKAPPAKKAPAAKKAPTAKKAPAAKRAPAPKKAPPAKKAPAVKKAPTTKKTPAPKKAPPAKKAPAIKKAPAASKNELTGPELSLQFTASLAQLEKYWHSKVDQLKKQANPSREELDEAINQANKYSALQDMIHEFENDWASQTILANNAPSKTRGKNAPIIAEEMVSNSLVVDLETNLEEDDLLEDMEDELTSDLDFENTSELEFADDSAAFFPDDDLFDEDSEDYSN
ncbi:MAG: hypothetical protein AB7I18_03410 [Candidatus Berkiella sp.]